MGNDKVRLKPGTKTNRKGRETFKFVIACPSTLVLGHVAVGS